MWWLPDAGPTRAIAVFVFAILVYLVHRLVLIIYNIFFHPLAKFPGPPWAAASYVPYAVKFANGTFHSWIKDLHDEYRSEVIRISPNDVSFINPQGWKDICAHRVGHTPFEKDVAVYGKAYNGIDTLLTAKKPDHSRMRRVLEYAFTTKALKEQTPVIYEHVDKLINALTARVNKTLNRQVDLADWYAWMTFDVIGDYFNPSLTMSHTTHMRYPGLTALHIGDLAFGESFECLQHEENHPWLQMIFGHLKGVAITGALKRFSVVEAVIPYLIPRSVEKMMADHFASTQAKLQRRIAKGTDRLDFVSPILENNTGKTLMDGEMEANASLFIIAGSDSMGIVLSGATWYLLQNPKAMEKLRDELEQNFRDEKEITLPKMEQLPYLCAVADETMRIYPVAMAGQASLIPPGGDTICGHFIPGGTGVSMNQYAVYHSATNFHEPESFIPERWLEGSGFADDKKGAFYPFSMGPRNCIGKHIGLAVPRLVLARMIWHFDIELCKDTDPDWTDQKVYIVYHKKPLIVRLTPRVREKGSM